MHKWLTNLFDNGSFCQCGARRYTKTGGTITAIGYGFITPDKKQK